MIATLRKCAVLLGHGQRFRWATVVLLAVLAAGVEVLGALLVLWLLVGITTAASGFDLPVVGDLRGLLPDVDEPALMAVIGASLAVFFVARGLIIVGEAYVQYRVAENAGARLAARLFAGYLAMPYSFHLQRNSAELIRNAYDTVQQFTRDALVPAVKLMSNSLMIAGLIGVLLITSPAATMLAIAVLGPFSWLLLRIVQPRVKRLGGTAQVMSKTSLQTLHESLAGWRDVELLGRRAFFVRRFRKDRRRLARARYLRSTAKEIPRVAMETGLVLFILGFLGASAIMGTGALDALPVLGLFGYAAVRLQPSLNEVFIAVNSLKFASAGIDLVHDDILVFRSPPPGLSESPASPRPLRRQLRVAAVTVRYPGARDDALSGVELTIDAGEFIGIVGPTGSGKSTLVDVMLGLTKPATGSVTVDGVDVHACLPDWHASLGAVHQVVFLADTTLRHNIAFGLPDDEIDDVLVEEAVTLAQLKPFVSSLPDGLDTVVGERGVKVSGGQRQRLAIARALYRRPSVLFFDEGTSALDTNTESQLMTALARLRGERTIVAVAHRLSTVHACDRVVLIDRGRVVDVAPFDELAARNRSLLQARG